MARLVVGAAAIGALAIPAIMDDSATSPAMRLVDDGGSNATTDPPYNPTPTPTTSPSTGTTPQPGGGNGGDDSGPGNGGESVAGLPVAAQAGISVGVIGLAALALIPGRRPPANLRP